MATTSGGNGDTDQAAYEQLSFYSLAHPDPAFIHQHVVDAFTAQHADASTKPIAVIFALVGLFLHVDRHRSGRQVQRVHTLMAKRRRQWPPVDLPTERRGLTVHDVLAAEPGPRRDHAIDLWCASVWQVYAASHGMIAELIRSIDPYPHKP